MIDIAVRTGTERRPELLHKYPWPARSPSGRDQYREPARHQGLVREDQACRRHKFPAERIVDNRVHPNMRAKLGPFVVENKDSKLEGCR